MGAGTIQGEFGWSNAGLITGMKEAEGIATRGAKSIEGKIASLFKRDPTQRAERAIGGFVERLAGGDVAGGIQALTGSMSAFGLAAGVAIGAGIGLFIKFKEQIDSAREAHNALQDEMIRRPLSLTGKMSTEGMTQALEARQKLSEEARKKTEASSFGRELLEAGKSTLPFFFGGRGKEDAERVQTQKDVNRAEAESKQIMLDRVKLASSLVAIETARVSGYEREANISKIVLDAEQKRAALQGSGVSREAFDLGDEAISRNAELQISLENKRAEAKERSLAIEERMANLVKRGATAEDQRKIRAGLELDAINEQLKKETSEPARRELLLKKTQKENELRGMRKPGGDENPFEAGTMSATNWERNAELQRRETERLSLNMTQEQRDLKKPKEKDQEVVKETKRVGDLIEKYWGQP